MGGVTHTHPVLNQARALGVLFINKMITFKKMAAHPMPTGIWNTANTRLIIASRFTSIHAWELPPKKPLAIQR